MALALRRRSGARPTRIERTLRAFRTRHGAPTRGKAGAERQVIAKTRLVDAKPTLAGLGRVQEPTLRRAVQGRTATPREQLGRLRGAARGSHGQPPPRSPPLKSGMESEPHVEKHAPFWLD